MLTKFLSVLLFLFAFSYSVYSANNPGGYSVGDKVSDFTIKNYDGAEYTLSSSGANATVIVFLSTSCPFVQPYTDRLNSLVNEFGTKGIALWGINSNNTESTDEVMNHASEKKYNFPVLKDNNNVVADQFAAERTPEVFVIDNATMTLIYHGRIDDNKEADKVTSTDLANALNEILNTKEISLKETKAFGCTIKR